MKYRPDHITVNDELGTRLVRAAWPDFDAVHIHETGFPALDRFADFDTNAAANEVRKYFALPLNARFVLFAGGGHHTAHALKQLVQAVNRFNDAFVLARPHPRMKEDFTCEILGWNAALRQLERGRDFGPQLLFDYFDMFRTDQLLAAATVVVACASTVNTEAAVLHRANISIEFPNRVGAHLAQAIPGLATWPTVELGCTAKASCQTELTSLLREAFNSELAARQLPFQERHFPTGGQSTSRVADVVERILG